MGFNKKGQAFVFLAALLFLFFMGLLFISLDRAHSFIVNENSSLMQNISGGQYEATFDKLDFMWNFFLVFLTIGVIIFMIISALRQRGAEFGV